MNILSLNIAHGLLETELLAYVTRHAAATDIFCFQETDPAIRSVLTELLSDTFSSHHTTRQNKDTEYYSSTYVRNGIEIVRVETPLDEIPETGAALSVTVLEGEGEVTISNVHGLPYPGHKLDTPERIAQSHGLLQFAESQPATHVFIGDFNLLPETESVKVFSKYGFDNLIKSFSIPTTRNAIAWDKFPDNKQLYADYAFIRSDTTAAYDFTVDPDVVSDHLPLRLSLEFNNGSITAMAAESGRRLVR